MLREVTPGGTVNVSGELSRKTTTPGMGGQSVGEADEDLPGKQSTFEPNPLYGFIVFFSWLWKNSRTTPHVLVHTLKKGMNPYKRSSTSVCLPGRYGSVASFDSSSYSNAYVDGTLVLPDGMDQPVQEIADDFWGMAERVAADSPEKGTAIATVYGAAQRGLADGQMMTRNRIKDMAKEFATWAERYGRRQSVEAAGKIFAHFLLEYSKAPRNFERLLAASTDQINRLLRSQGGSPSPPTFLAPPPIRNNVRVRDLAVDPLYTEPMDTLLSVGSLIIKFALGKIPVVGGLVSGLFGFLWDTFLPGESVWDQIKDEVQQLVDEAIDAAIYALLKQELEGLKNALADYLNAIKLLPGDKANAQQTYVAVDVLFGSVIPKFQNPTQRWALLPLFAYAATLHITLLRDGAIHGQEWGNSYELTDNIMQKAHAKIVEYKGYVDEQLAIKTASVDSTSPHTNTPGQEGVPWWRTEYWNYVVWVWNARQEAVLDVAQYWPDMDPTVNTTAVKTHYASALFSDAYGGVRKHGGFDEWDSECRKYGNNVTSRVDNNQSNVSTVYAEFYGGNGPTIFDVNFLAGKPYEDRKAGMAVGAGDLLETNNIIAERQAGYPGLTGSWEFEQDDPIVYVSVRTGDYTNPEEFVRDIRGFVVWTKSGRKVTFWDKTNFPGGKWYYYGNIASRSVQLFSFYSLATIVEFVPGAAVFTATRDKALEEPPVVTEHLYVTQTGTPNPVIQKWEAKRLGHWANIATIAALP